MTTNELDLEPPPRTVHGRSTLEELVPGVPGLIDASLDELSPATARRIYELSGVTSTPPACSAPAI